MEIELKATRCFCVHSALQAVDVVLRSVLFQRQFTADLVERLLESDEKFAAEYFKVANVLRDFFRSRNRELIREVVIVVGPSCHSPREYFRIPISLCSDEASTSGCGAHCGELTQKETKALYRGMMTSFPVFKKLRKTDRAYIAICAHDSLDLPSFEDIGADEEFEVSDEAKVLQTRISLHHDCLLDAMPPTEGSFRWFRVIPHFRVTS